MVKGIQRNPYKCMNVMKQDAMDDKIKEGCKIGEKKNLSTRKMLSIQIPKTHTHTHTHTTSLTNFIFQKQVKTVQ